MCIAKWGPYSIAHVALDRRRAWGDLLSGGDAADFPRDSAAFQVREVDGAVWRLLCV
jgi:hypothetical protein